MEHRLMQEAWFALFTDIANGTNPAATYNDTLYDDVPYEEHSQYCDSKEEQEGAGRELMHLASGGDFDDFPLDFTTLAMVGI